MFNLNDLMGFGQQPNAAESTKIPDTSEQVHVSPLALLKMMRHCRAGIPFEVMGMMLGEFDNDGFAINVIDVFAMPQMATTVSVEAIDPVYQ